MEYAVFPHSHQYHLVRANGYATFCGLPVKRQARGVAERLSPAVVTLTQPVATYAPCEQCHLVRAFGTLNEQTKQPPAA